MSVYSIDFATNIENVLLFGVTQHVSTLLEGAGVPMLDASTVLLLCVLFAVGDWLVVAHVQAYAQCSQRVLFAQVVVSIFSNMLLTKIASSSQAVQYTRSDWWSLLTIAQSTVILIVFACLPPGSPGDTARAYRLRMKGLFLYMYTENLTAQVQRVQQRTVLAVCSLLVYAVVHVQAKRLAQSRIRQYLSRACNMLAINCVLNMTSETKTGLLVLMLLSFDVIAVTAEWYAEIRGYALFRAARYLQNLYNEQWRDPALAVAVCILGLAGMRLRQLNAARGSSEQTLAELVVLVSVNVIVQQSTPDVSTDSAARGLVLLVLYLIRWDVLLGQIV